jgi:hypothetical protein
MKILIFFLFKKNKDKNKTKKDMYFEDPNQRKLLKFYFKDMVDEHICV